MMKNVSIEMERKEKLRAECKAAGIILTEPEGKFCGRCERKRNYQKYPIRCSGCGRTFIRRQKLRRVKPGERKLYAPKKIVRSSTPQHRKGGNLSRLRRHRDRSKGKEEKRNVLDQNSPHSKNIYIAQLKKKISSLEKENKDMVNLYREVNQNLFKKLTQATIYKKKVSSMEDEYMRQIKSLTSHIDVLVATEKNAYLNNSEKVKNEENYRKKLQEINDRNMKDLNAKCNQLLAVKMEKDKIKAYLNKKDVICYQLEEQKVKLKQDLNKMKIERDTFEKGLKQNIQSNNILLEDNNLLEQKIRKLQQQINLIKKVNQDDNEFKTNADCKITKRQRECKDLRTHNRLLRDNFQVNR